LIGKVRFVSLGHDSQTRTPFYLVSSEFTETGDEFSDGLLEETIGFGSLSELGEFHREHARTLRMVSMRISGLAARPELHCWSALWTSGHSRLLRNTKRELATN